MTAVVTRQPLQTLSMSSSQRGPRRLSARLQEKEDGQLRNGGRQQTTENSQTSGPGPNGVAVKKAPDRPPATKKRRIGESR